MPKILFISGWNVNVRSSGMSQCTARNYEALCAYFGKENIETINMFESIFKLGFFEKLKRKLCMLCFYRWPGLTARIENQILEKTTEKDLVFINESSYGKLSKQVKKKYPKIKIVAFFHNIEYECAKEEHSKTIIHLWLARRTIFRNESYACLFSDAVITLNSRDTKLLQNIYHRSADTEIPISLPDKQINYNYSPINEVPIGLFLGVDVYTNIHGMQWFIQKVLPNVNIRLIVVGRGMDKINFLHSNKLEILGYVDDLEPYMQNADFMIYPIFKGGGMKVKTCEALMHGKNIIGTKEAFMGYDIDFEEVGACCETTEEFIEAINEFPKKFAHKFNEYSRSVFLKKYSNDVIFERFADLLGRLV